MPQRSTAHGQDSNAGREEWYVISLRQEHIPIYRAWAQHLGWSGGALANRIFQMGVIAFGTAHLSTVDPAALDAVADELTHSLLERINAHITASEQGET